jgi:cytochrome c
MKKLFVIVSFSFIIVSCGNQNNTPLSTPDKTSPSTPDKTSPSTTAENAETTKGLNLISKSDCLSCHKVSEKLVGPAYQAVAERYTATDEVIDTLAQKVIQGGAGRWGGVAMTPHPQIAKEDAKTMVRYILSLKK